MLIRLQDVGRMLGLTVANAGRQEWPWPVVLVGRVTYTWRSAVAAWMVENGGVATAEEAEERMRAVMTKPKRRVKRVRLELAA